MKNKKLLFSFLAGVFILTLSSCKQGPKDSDKILDAQNCLDSATAATVETCVQKVEGMDSQGAYLIRCVGKFVSEGFSNSSKIGTALDALKAGGNGASGSTSMIAALAFTSQSTESANATSAETTLDYCNKAKSKGLVFLAGLAQTSTLLASLSAGIDLSDPSTINGANLLAAMTALAGNPVAQTAVGSAIVSIYESSCAPGQVTTGNYCEQFQSAVGAVSGGITNPAGIGQQIMTCYNDPTADGCSGF